MENKLGLWTYAVYRTFLTLFSWTIQQEKTNLSSWELVSVDKAASQNIKSDRVKNSKNHGTDKWDTRSGIKVSENIIIYIQTDI